MSQNIFETLFCNVVAVMAITNFDIEFQKSWFANLNEAKQQELLDKRQSEKTRIATKSHVKLLEEYLEFQSMKKLEEITNAE